MSVVADMIVNQSPDRVPLTLFSKRATDSHAFPLLIFGGRTVEEVFLGRDICSLELRGRGPLL